ncbi:hypothetical protein Pint_26257 [Pistacia integerrima]|uniref:Uncharacterized protein n=1 Tax=Pistacia integerrima TaxID=434235 RepID=A0ACC0YEK5_9ROSI|nr:hypothetical protein Pint_26257 [Pistacia integerrima]
MADSRRMYSWWWDSHISPKNSKWLQGRILRVLLVSYGFNLHLS